MKTKRRMKRSRKSCVTSGADSRGKARPVRASSHRTRKPSSEYRTVQFVAQDSVPVNAASVERAKKQIQRKKKSVPICPNAPQNTSSFLIDQYCSRCNEEIDELAKSLQGIDAFGTFQIMAVSG